MNKIESVPRGWLMSAKLISVNNCVALSRHTKAKTYYNCYCSSAIFV